MEFPNVLSEQSGSLMHGTRQVEVIIPAYNEEKRIGRTLASLVSLSEVKRILVVFEGNDRTPEIAKGFPKCEVYTEDGRRLGKGGAIKKGIELADGSAKIAIIDADLPVSLDSLRFLLSIDDADLVIVKRNFVKITKARLILHKGFKALVKLFFPSLFGISDFQAGVKVMRADRAKEVLNELVINDLLIDVNLIYAFKRRGFKIREVEVDYLHDEANSKISKKLLKVIALMFLSLIKLRVYYSPFRRILYTRPYKYLEKEILKILV